MSASPSPATGVRVCHVKRFAVWGGSEVNVVETVGALRRAGADVSLAVLDDGAGGRAAAQARSLGVPTLVVRVRGRELLGLPRRLRRHLAEHRVDIVHVHHTDARLLVRVLTPRRAMVTTMHSLEPQWYADPVRRWLARRLLAHCARVVAPSRFLAAYVEHDGGVAPERIELVHHGVADHFPRAWRKEPMSGRPPVMGMFSRLVEGKGHEDTIHAAALVPGARLLVVGEGPRRETLEGLARDLGVDACFVGERPRVRALMLACSVVVVPTHRELGEGLGLVGLEALACGRPLVCSDVGALPEVVEPGRSGAIVPERDPEALARAVGELTDPERWRATSRHARARYETAFALGRMADDLVAVYRRILAERASPRRRARRSAAR